MSKKFKIDALDYFSGGVPHGIHFKATLDDILKINASSDREKVIDRLSELCFVGVLSYFEAFCKDHAATIIGILPQAVKNLSANGYNTTIEPHKALEIGYLFPVKIGFLALESIDFGGAKKINSIYQSLIKITPFSKENAIRYEGLLRDRNLVVHHGSIYTYRYVDQISPEKLLNISDAYYNSLVINGDSVSETINFISNLAENMLNSSYKSLQNICAENKIKLSKEQKKALEYMKVWDDN